MCVKCDLRAQIDELARYEAQLEETSHKFTDLFFFHRYKTIENTCVYLFRQLLASKSPLPWLERMVDTRHTDSTATATATTFVVSELDLARNRNENLKAENRLLSEKNRVFASEIWSLKSGTFFFS
jgi:hypothetical protein